MRTALLFDIDGTLTPPRLPITKSMADVLMKLTVPFHIAAGSHMELLEKQFFEPLYQFGFRDRFDAFVGNGAIHYCCDYSAGPKIRLIDVFDIREYLGNISYAFLLDILRETLEIPEFRLPSHIKVFGETISYRTSMVNLTPIGRVKVETPEIQKNRINFVLFDRSTNYRLNILSHCNNVFSELIAEKDLRITLGGQTSFDIGILNQDKSKAVKTLLRSGIDRLIFFGDALFERGNDTVIREYINTMPQGSNPTAEYHQVGSYEETIDLLHRFDFF